MTDFDAMLGYTHVFARPDDYTSIIDVVHPATGRSLQYDHTLAQVRERYPDAVIMEWTTWRDAKIALQDRPVGWTEITRARYRELFECLPPAVYNDRGFLVGEPWDHHCGNGRPRYAACVERAGRYYTSTRPMTVQEFRELRR